MHYYLLVLSVVGGICLAFGVLFLFVSLRRRHDNQLSLAFSLFALFYAGAVLTGVNLYSAASLADYVRLSRWDGLFVVLAFTSIVWFVAGYTGVRPRPLLWLLTVAYIGTGIANAVRANLIYDEIFGLTYVTLPWGEQQTQLEGSDSIWMVVFFLAQLVTIGFILFACLRQFRRGAHRAAIGLGTGLAWLIVTIIVDLLVDAGIAPFYIGDFGFLGLAVVVSLQMANGVIRTEEELERYQHELEDLVEERTAQLQLTNQHLTDEVAVRERTEKALRQSEASARALMNAPPDSALLIDPQGIILDINQIAADRLGLSPPLAPDTSIYDLMELDLVALPRARLEEVAATRQPVRWQDVRGGIHLDNSLYPVLDADGRVVSIAVFAADITERKQAEEALRQRIEELATLRDIALKLQGSTELYETLEQVGEVIAYLFNACYTRIVLVGDKAGDLVLLGGFERNVPLLARTRVVEPLSELPPVQQVLRRGQPMVVSEVQSLPLSPLVREFLTGRGVQSLMLVPLLVRGSAIGLLAIATDNAEWVFSADDLGLAETIASDIAGTIENARLLEQVQAAAAAEERGRIARELHDSVTQTLYSVSIVAEALPRLLERDVSAAKYQAVYLRQTVLGALAEMRTLLFELRPAALAKSSLHVLLQQQADILTGRTRVPVDLVIEGEGVLLPTDVKIALYRIAQEVLNNIARHAKASQVWATSHNGPDGVMLVIRDDGRGFDPASVTPEHMGLRIVHERAEKIGARLNIESEPGRGTQVTVEWTAARDGGHLGETKDA